MKLLVIEDEPRMRESLEAGLRQHGFVVDSSGLGIEGEEMALKNDYDLIVLDVMLPDRDGTDVCRNLRQNGQTTPVLMLTALAATDEKIDGLDAGADDYLTKPFEFAELIARIRAVLRRGQASESHTLKYGDLELDLYTRSATRAGKTFELSNKEFMLLELLMRHPNRVLTRPFIGEKVWDMNFDPTSNVIDVYIAMLRKQIDKDFDEPLIHTIKGAGYRFGTRE
jgi:two-component system copper resistance phosphate regulon response regulator CusR